MSMPSPSPDSLNVMATSPLLAFDLGDLAEEIVASSLLDASTFCCCRGTTEPFWYYQHLDDCVVGVLHKPSDMSEDSDAKEVERKRRHRECVARLRHNLRASVAALQAQERQLEQELRFAIASRQVEPAQSPLAKLRLAYSELVSEQLDLRDEQEQLLAMRARDDKFHRLAQRELEKVRMFHV